MNDQILFKKSIESLDAYQKSLGGLLASIVFEVGRTLVYNMRQDDKLIGLHHELLGLAQKIAPVKQYCEEGLAKLQPTTPKEQPVPPTTNTNG